MNVRRTTKLREEFAVLSVVGVSSEPPSVPTQVVHAQAAKKRQDEGCYSRAEILSELPPYDTAFCITRIPSIIFNKHSKLRIR